MLVGAVEERQLLWVVALTQRKRRVHQSLRACIRLAWRWGQERALLLQLPTIPELLVQVIDLPVW